MINCLSTRLNGKAPYSTINWHGLKSIRYVPVYRMFIMIETQIILHGNITLNEQGELQYAKSAQYLLEKPASSSDSLLRKVSVLFFHFETRCSKYGLGYYALKYTITM